MVATSTSTSCSVMALNRASASSTAASSSSSTVCWNSGLVRSALRSRSMWAGAATTNPQDAMPRTRADASSRNDPNPCENSTSGNGPSAEAGTSRKVSVMVTVSTDTGMSAGSSAGAAAARLGGRASNWL